MGRVLCFCVRLCGVGATFFWEVKRPEIGFAEMGFLASIFKILLRFCY